MHSNSRIKKVFLLGMIALVLFTGAATALNIDILNEPLNKDYVGNDTDTVRVVNITNSGEPLDDQDIGSDFYLNYTYNETGGETADLKHLSNGYWYAEITPDAGTGSYIKYRIQEKTGTQDKAEASEKLSYGNYSLELMSDIGSRLTPGEAVDLRVNVTDEADGEPETGASVTAYFTNGTETLAIQGLNNQDGSEYYNSQINTPDNYGERYVLHINASNTGDSHIAPEGTLSIPIQMEPPITGDIEYLEATSGCNNASFFRECERDTEISTGLNVSGEVPNSVTFSVEQWNISSGEWETYSSMEMDNNSIYEADTVLPDLNNTAYDRDIRLVYNASGDEVDSVKNYMITIRDYKVRFGASTSTRQGGDYNLELAFEKYFSSQPLDDSRIDADINITNSTHTLKQFDLSDLEYENGVFQRDVQIGSDWPSGTYDIDVRAEDIYGNEVTSENSFFVREVDTTFEITEEIDEDVITATNYEFNLTIDNVGSSELNLTTNVSEDIEEFTEIEDYVIVPASGKNVTVGFNLTGMRMEDRSGEIEFEDEGGFNDTADVELDIPGCDYRDGAYCMEGSLNETRDERGYALEEVTVYYLANETDEVDLAPTASGNLSDVLVFNPETKEMNSSNNEQSFIANYSAQSPGYFTGSVAFGTLSVPVEFISDVESTELSIEVPSSIDLGTMPVGGSATTDMDVTNNGDTDIVSISLESTDMEVSTESAEIPVGETKTFTVEISDISSAGQITVTADSATKQIGRDVSVEVELVEDLGEKASELRDELNRLQSKVTTSENQNILNTASLNVSEIENAYRRGDYERAQKIYDSTEANLERVSASVDTETSTGGNNTATPGDTNTEPTSSSSDSSILLLIGSIVFILLIAGFILYTSYIPEEGDPLYGVIGR